MKRRITMKCLKCGAENQLGHIFCRNCGAKLNFDEELDKELFKHKISHLTFFRCIRPVLIFGALGALILALWPAPLSNQKSTYAGYRAAKAKMGLMKKHAIPSRQVFSENEVNAYLVIALARANNKRNTDSFLGRACTVSSIYVEIKQNVMKVIINKIWFPSLFERIQIKPFRTTFCLAGNPQVQNANFSFSTRNVYIGHLFLPGLLAYPVQAFGRQIFLPMEKEDAFLDNIDKIELSNGEIIVSFKP